MSSETCLLKWSWFLLKNNNLFAYILNYQTCYHESLFNIIFSRAGKVLLWGKSTYDVLMFCGLFVSGLLRVFWKFSILCTVCSKSSFQNWTRSDCSVLLFHFFSSQHYSPKAFLTDDEATSILMNHFLGKCRLDLWPSHI